MIRAAILIGLIAAATPAAARDPIFGLPIDCTLGESCYIQNYVDADAGPGHADFTCGSLTYDGHKGTDFALLSLAALTKGVNVLATSPGRVTALRDGEPDIAHQETSGQDYGGRDCGNGLILDHGGGWITQYCHLKNGSINVAKGQRVAMGAVLGQVGLSGRTEYPNLHISIRYNDEIIDPFNRDGITTCADQNDDQLWRDPIPYRAGGLLAAGFSPEMPTFRRITDGQASQATLPKNAAALILWGYAFGGQAGDEIKFTIIGAEGIFRTSTQTLDKNLALFFRASGRKLTTANTRPGQYVGTVTLIRDGKIIDVRAAKTTLLE